MWEMGAVLPALAWSSIHCPFSFFSLLDVYYQVIYKFLADVT